MGGKVQVILEGFNPQEKVGVTIYDMAGRALQPYELVADNHGSSGKEILLNQKMSRGLYVLKAQAASGEVHKKLVLE